MGRAGGRTRVQEAEQLLEWADVRRGRGADLLRAPHQARGRETPAGLETIADTYRASQRAQRRRSRAGRPLVFTDPHYGLGEGFGGLAEQEQPVRGVYRIPGGGEPEPLVGDFSGRTGLALSPNGRTLYVMDTEEFHLRAFAMASDWALSGGDVLVELLREVRAYRHGLKLDLAGNIYRTGAGGVWICSPEGELLGQILPRGRRQSRLGGR